MANSFYAKVYRIGSETMLAACDKDLIGKKFREGEIVLHVKEDFYKDKAIGEAELKKLLSESTIINLVGEGCISVAEDMGMVENKMIIQNIPHVQIFEMRV